MDIRQISDKLKKGEMAAAILHNLPDWFGLPESTREYIVNSMDIPFFAAMENGKPLGLLSQD